MPGVRLLTVSTEEGEVVYPPDDYTPQTALEARRATVFECGDVIKVAVLSAAVTRLRRVRGLLPTMHKQLECVGGKRRIRQLAEMSVNQQSMLIRHPLSQLHLSNNFGMTILSVRRTTGPPVCRRDFEKFQLQAGDVMLCEVPQKLTYFPPPEFSLVAPVPNSRPPRVGRRADDIRAWIVVGCLISLLFMCWVQPDLQSHLACLYLLLVFIYLFIRSCNYGEVYKSLNGPVLLTIAAAFGVATGFRESGAMSAVGRGLICVAEHLPAGDLGLYVAIFVAGSALSSVITSNATVILLAGMITEAATDKGAPISSAFLVLIYAG